MGWVRPGPGPPEIQRRARPWLSADWQPASALGEAPPERLGFDYLISLKGIGPYAAAHCRVLLHDFSRLPVDSGVIAYLRERYGCDPTEFAASRSSWGPYLALGYRLARLRNKLAASS